jgi:hypothetical protein
VTVSLDTGATDAGTTVEAPREPAVNPVVNAAVAALPDLRTAVQGLVAAPPVVPAPPARQSVVPAPEPFLAPSQPSPVRSAPAGATARDGETSEGALALSLPRATELLPVLPPFDLATLERGLQRFLDQLARLGEDLAWPQGGAGTWPWIVAAVAAAAACEIARRQLRPRAGGTPLAADGFPGTLWDGAGEE